MNPKETQRLQALLKNFDGGAVQPEELAETVKTLLDVIKRVQDDVTEELSSYKGENSSNIEKRLSEVNQLITELRSAIGETRQLSATSIQNAVQSLLNQLEAVSERIPEMPDFTDVWSRIDAVENKIPVLPPEKTAEYYRDALEALPNEDDKLRIEAVGHLKNKLSELEQAIKNGRNVSIAGTPRGFQVYVDGVKKGLISVLNFKSGSNMSISHSKVNGLDTLTFTASGGAGGLTIETPTGAVNASNRVFGVSDEPQYMVADGTTYFAGAGYTYSAPNVTFDSDITPSSYVRAII